MTSVEERRRWVRRTIKCLAAVALVIPCLLFGASLIGGVTWSPVNCWHHDVDIHSGRLRYTRYIFWMPVRHRIEDSALSAALFPNGSDGAPAEWHHVLTFSPGVHHSPNYIFHSAINQIHKLEGCWSGGKFTPEARQASAKRVLQLWQQNGNDNAAGDYLHALEQTAFSGLDTTNTITEADLPKF